MTAADGSGRSPLDAVHRALGAKMVPFGGWEMPLSYPAGTLDEHLACRRDAVVFDVSHLGTVRVSGPDALGLLQAAFTNDLTKVSPGRAQYTHLLDPADASVLDDIIVWWLDDTVFDVMPNASNTARAREAIGGIDTTDCRRCSPRPPRWGGSVWGSSSGVAFRAPLRAPVTPVRRASRSPCPLPMRRRSGRR